MRGNNKLDVPWSSISDMMAALMMVFLFISVGYAFQVSQQARELSDQTERISQIVSEYEDYNRLIYDDLMTTFDHRLQDWNAEIEEGTLAFRFKNPSTLFRPGSAEITPQYAKVLQAQKSEFITVGNTKVGANNFEKDI